MRVLQLGASAGNGVVADFLADTGVPTNVANPLGSAITFVVTLVVLYYLGKTVLLPVVRRSLDRQGIDRHASIPLQRLATILIGFVALALAFSFAGYGNILTSLATVGAAATLAIGFALQNVLSNFVAGVFIFTDKPFRIGDWIEFDGNEGVVEDISLRVTRIRTFDNELLTVPNSLLTDGVIKNPVAKEQLRLQFLFGIGYDDDIDRATDIIVEEAENHDGILDDPPTTVRLTQLGDSSVGLKSRFWIAQPQRSDFVQVRSEYVQSVKERFDEEGIDIPYPNRTMSGSLDVSGYEAVADD